MILKTLWEVANIMGWVPPLHVWTDTQSENITSHHPSDAGGKYRSLPRIQRIMGGYVFTRICLLKPWGVPHPS